MHVRLFIRLAILCILGCLVQGRPQTLEKCGKRYAPIKKIVGGKFALPGEYPWMVSLHLDKEGNKKFEHICGATILNEHYIVTAAHCVFDWHKQPWRYEVYVGVHKLSKKLKPPAKRYKIDEVILHEHYSNITEANDIALLHTVEPIQFKGTDGYVNGICLPTSDADPKGWAEVTGWGHTEEDGKISNVLKTVKVPLIPRALCHRAYNDDGDENDIDVDDSDDDAVDHDDEEDYDEDYDEEYSGDNGFSFDVDWYVKDSQICAGTSERDSCQNDSGGPLIQKNYEGAYTLIGIVSYGKGCGNRHFPGVYTKVAYYMDWLEKHMVDVADNEVMPRDELSNTIMKKFFWV